CKDSICRLGVVVLATIRRSLRLSDARLRRVSPWHDGCTGTRAKHSDSDRRRRVPQMIAGVRLFRHGAFVGSRVAPHLWCFVLAGGTPRRGPATPKRAPDGFVEPGSPLDGLEDLSLLAVRRFVYEAPRGLCARGLLAPAALAVRARALVALGRRYIPEVLETLEPLEDVADAPEATLLAEAVYECMPYASLSREFLERIPDLAVLPVPDARRGRECARGTRATG